MKCTVSYNAEYTHFAYESDATDLERAGRVSIANHDFRVYRDLSSSHNDIVALIAIFGIVPWVGEEVDCNISVSPVFADAVAASLRFDMVNVDATLKPRQKPVEGKVGIAYSGGADCTAAMTLLKDAANAYFMDRVTRPGEVWKGVYRKEAAYHSIDQLSKHVSVVRSVETDLEFLRDPVGFPDDLSNIIPALSYADEDRLDGVGWGSIFESMYRVGLRRFRDYKYNPAIRDYGPVFRAVGLGVVNAVAGVSEVGTAKINKVSGFDRFAQSCMRGKVGAPCRRCWKCARKIMVDSALTHSWPNETDLDALLSSKESRSRLTEDPIILEVVVAFAANRYGSGIGRDSPIMGALAEKLASHQSELLQRYYPPALDLLPGRYADIVRSNLEEYLDPMTEKEQLVIQGWNAETHLESSRRRVGSGWLSRAFEIVDEGAER